MAMATSQENAVASALKELDIPYGQKLEVADLSEGSAAQGKLKKGDVFTSINGKPVTSLAVIQEELAAGKGKPAVVVVSRDGKQVTETVTPAEQPVRPVHPGRPAQVPLHLPVRREDLPGQGGRPERRDDVRPGNHRHPDARGPHRRQTHRRDRHHHPRRRGGPHRRHRREDARRPGRRRHHVPGPGGELRTRLWGIFRTGCRWSRWRTWTRRSRAVELAAKGADTSGLPACTNN